MQIKTIGLIALSLSVSACGTLSNLSTAPEPFVGELVSVELLFGDPYNKNWALEKEESSGKDEVIIVSNACGYAKAGFQILNNSSEKGQIVTLGQVIGEWCRNPFEDIQHHEHYLIVPINKNTNRVWQKGTFKGTALGIYKTPTGHFADISQLDYFVDHETRFLEPGQSPKSRLELLQEKIIALGIEAPVETLSLPAVIRNIEESREIELYGIEKDLYTVNNSELLLMKGLRIDEFFNQKP